MNLRHPDRNASTSGAPMAWVPLAMKQNKAFNSVRIDLFGTDTIVLYP